MDRHGEDKGSDSTNESDMLGDSNTTQQRTERQEKNQRFLSDPTKYDRDGHLRESWKIRHLPKVSDKCAPTRSPTTPELDGLPVTLPSLLTVDNTFVHKENVESLLGKPLHSTGKALLADGEATLKKYRWQSCAIVGNSGSLLNSNYGPVIDKHSVVMRLNQAPVTGYERHVGSKTTFRLLNNMWLHRYSTPLSTKDNLLYMPWEGLELKPIPPTELPLEHGSTMILTRYTPEEAEQIVKFWERKRPDVTVMLLNSRLVSVVRQLLQGYRVRLCKAGYGPFEGGTVPSSGLVGAYMLSQMCRSVTAYGFGVAGEAQGKRATAYHYYKTWGSRPTGNFEAHSFDAELALMNKLLSPKRAYPEEGHMMWRPNGAKEGNLRICRPNDKGAVDVHNYWCRAGTAVLDREASPTPSDPLDRLLAPHSRI